MELNVRQTIEFIFIHNLLNTGCTKFRKLAFSNALTIHLLDDNHFSYNQFSYINLASVARRFTCIMYGVLRQKASGFSWETCFFSHYNVSLFVFLMLVTSRCDSIKRRILTQRE